MRKTFSFILNSCYCFVKHLCEIRFFCGHCNFQDEQFYLLLYLHHMPDLHHLPNFDVYESVWQVHYLKFSCTWDLLYKWTLKSPSHVGFCLKNFKWFVWVHPAFKYFVSIFSHLYNNYCNVHTCKNTVVCLCSYRELRHNQTCDILFCVIIFC